MIENLIYCLGFPFAWLICLVTLRRVNLFKDEAVGVYLLGIMFCVTVIMAFAGWLGWILTGFLIDLIRT